MVRLPEDDDKVLSRCQNGYQKSARSRLSSICVANSLDSSPGVGNKADCASSSSSLLALNQPHFTTSVQNVVVGSSDESESEPADVDSGSKLFSDSHASLKASDWGNLSGSSPIDEHEGNRGDALITKSGYSSKNRGVSKHPLSWQGRCMVQPARLHDPIINNVADGHPRGASTSYQTHRAYRKGSSSKAPQTNDLTAPLLLGKSSRSITYKALQGESEDHALVSLGALGSKIRNTTLPQNNHSTSSGTEASSRRKSNSYTSHGHNAKTEEMGTEGKIMNRNGPGYVRRGLTNLTCSFSTDVLPAVTSSTLNNLTCSPSVDVLPSVSNTISGSGYLHSRRSSRALTSEGETSRRAQPLKWQVEEAEILSNRELENGAEQQASYGPGQSVSRSARASHNHPNEVEASGAGFVPSEISMPRTMSPSPLLTSNHRQYVRNEALPRSGDGLQSLYRSSGSCLEANSPFGELSNEWFARRRSLHRSRIDPLSPDGRSSSRNYRRDRHSGSNWLSLQEMHPRFSGPPARPPPLPPVAGFAELSSSEISFNRAAPASSADYSYSSQPSAFVPDLNTGQAAAAAVAESSSSNHTMSNDDNQARLTVEGLSEILSALEYIERDEDLSYEQILMLEATVLLGGIDLHDRYRDMRIDIDNMSYEELLALEERIGNVNTGLSEDSMKKIVRVETFTSPEATRDYVPQEIEIKCSICQEEFEDSVELGVLDCGHIHHVACIEQWLLQKNQCPICKAPALP